MPAFPWLAVATALGAGALATGAALALPSQEQRKVSFLNEMYEIAGLLVLVVAGAFIYHTFFKS